VTKSLSQVAWIPETSTATIILRCVGSNAVFGSYGRFFQESVSETGYWSVREKLYCTGKLERPRFG